MSPTYLCSRNSPHGTNVWREEKNKLFMLLTSWVFLSSFEKDQDEKLYFTTIRCDLAIVILHGENIHKRITMVVNWRFLGCSFVQWVIESLQLITKVICLCICSPSVATAKSRRMVAMDKFSSTKVYIRRYPKRFTGIVGQNPFVSKSNRLHVDVFRFFFIELLGILYKSI